LTPSQVLAALCPNVIFILVLVQLQRVSIRKFLQEADAKYLQPWFPMLFTSRYNFDYLCSKLAGSPTVELIPNICTLQR